MEYIKLNVGGYKYLTTRHTLQSKNGSSMLARMFGDLNGMSPSLVDEEGHYVIDRNGRLFEYVLDYLRGGSFPPSSIPIADIELLIGEADFYGLDELQDWATRKLQDNSRLQTKAQEAEGQQTGHNKSKLLESAATKSIILELRSKRLDTISFQAYNVSSIEQGLENCQRGGAQIISQSFDYKGVVQNYSFGPVLARMMLVRAKKSDDDLFNYPITEKTPLFVSTPEDTPLAFESLGSLMAIYYGIDESRFDVLVSEVHVLDGRNACPQHYNRQRGCRSCQGSGIPVIAFGQKIQLQGYISRYEGRSSSQCDGPLYFLVILEQSDYQKRINMGGCVEFNMLGIHYFEDSSS